MAADTPISMGTVYATDETEKAIRVVSDDYGFIWIPKSQIHADSEVWKAWQTGELVVNAWFAEKNGYS